MKFHSKNRDLFVFNRDRSYFENKQYLKNFAILFQFRKKNNCLTFHLLGVIVNLHRLYKIRRKYFLVKLDHNNRLAKAFGCLIVLVHRKLIKKVKLIIINTINKILSKY